MGLDMFLTKETFLSSYPKPGTDLSHREMLGITGIEKAGIKTSRVQAITEQIGQWRKANAIHNWFVNEVQGGVDECQKSDVSEDQLAELAATCDKVLRDHTLAETLLPVQAGFFFGTYDYDDWYFEDLEYTRDMLTAFLNEPEYGAIAELEFWPTYHYQASW